MSRHWEDLGDVMIKVCVANLPRVYPPRIETFMNATRTPEQCRHACRILRIESSPDIPSAMIGRILGIGRTLVNHHFKKGLNFMDAPPRNGQPSFLSHEQ
jgi:hypothetical protein